MSSHVYTVRPSHIIKHDDCPAAFYMQYIEGIRTAATSINLPFGTQVHNSCTGHLQAVMLAKQFDPVKVFESAFEEALNTQTLEFPSDKSAEDYLAMGKTLVERFPEAWEQSGLTPLVDSAGEPVIERRLQTRIAPGIILSGTPDVPAMSDEGEICVPDLKTAGQASDPIFILASEQLTAYQILLEDPVNQQHLGVDQIDQLGFMEGIKRKRPKTNRGQGPTWEPIKWSPARESAPRKALVEKAVAMKRDIDRDWFPKRPRMAFNTPCGLCDYRNWCHKGDPTGLVWPEKTEAQPIRLTESAPAVAQP